MFGSEGGCGLALFAGSCVTVWKLPEHFLQANTAIPSHAAATYNLSLRYVQFCGYFQALPSILLLAIRRMLIWMMRAFQY